MAGEIEIPLKISPQRTNNANACWDQLTQSTNAFQPAGWRFRNGEAAEVNAVLTRRIPASINATPNGTVVLHWVTDSATGNNVKWYVNVASVTHNTTSLDPAAWTDALSVVDTNLGAFVSHECSVSIVTSALTSGLGLMVNIKRDAGDVADTLAADVLLLDALFVADE